MTSLTQTTFSEISGDISPDGRWLAYDSDESGQHEVYVRPFPAVDQGRRLVSRAGGTEPLWAPRGQELFYLAADGALMAVPVDAVKETASFAAGAPSRVMAPGEYRARTPNHAGRTYDVSPDGNRFLRIKIQERAATTSGPQNIVVLQNWIEELKRLVPTK